MKIAYLQLPILGQKYRIKPKTQRSFIAADKGTRGRVCSFLKLETKMRNYHGFQLTSAEHLAQIWPLIVNPCSVTVGKERRKKQQETVGLKYNLL